jgi:hypothetical protein
MDGFAQLVDDEAWDVVSLDESIKAFLDSPNAEGTEFMGKTDFTRVTLHTYSRGE